MRLLGLLLILPLAAFAVAPAAAQDDAPPSPPAAPDLPDARLIEGATANAAQAQLDAYNAHDIDAFLAVYADTVAAYNFPGELLGRGKLGMHQAYAPMFERLPDLHAEVTERIVLGRYAIDRERVTGLPDGETAEVVAIYEVNADGKIARVWFMRP